MARTAGSEATIETAGQIAAAVREGRMTAVSAVERALGRAHRLQADLNCFVAVLDDHALAAAAAADKVAAAGGEIGPLHGVPIAIKDLTPMAGQVATLGSWTTPDEPAARSALVVERLVAAGAIVIGRTTTPEFASSAFTASPRWGVTRNPWDPSRTTGGSSGGSGAAVAGGCVPLAEGTDMGGSVRIPAALCGVIGFKPSLGRIPMTILPSVFDDLSHFGPIARTVADAALFMQAASGPSDEDPLSLDRPFEPHRAGPASLRGRRFALSMDLGYHAVQPGVAAAVRRAAEALEAAGATIEEVALPWSRAVTDGWLALWGVFMAAYFGDRLAAFRPRMDPGVVALIEAGQALGAADYKRIEILRTAMWRDLAALLAHHDALLCPTCAVVAPPATQTDDDYGQTLADGRFSSVDLCAPFNLVSALPVLSLPVGLSEGLPVGLQIVGRRHADEDVLAIAGAVEALLPGIGSPPPF